MEYPTSRAAAKAINSEYYYTGIPCKHNHLALRKTNKGCCIECRKVEWTKNNEKRKHLPKSEAAKESGRRYYEKNREAVIARAAARTKEEKNRYKLKHKQNNPEYYNALNSFRKRRHREATPKWLTYQQKQNIKALYMQAITMTNITGERYVVDHIVPLINDAVCGLHVPWNLRVITQEENLIKSNKMDANNL